MGRILMAFLFFFLITRLMTILRNKRSPLTTAGWKGDLATAFFQTIVVVFMSDSFTCTACHLPKFSTSCKFALTSFAKSHSLSLRFLLNLA